MLEITQYHSGYDILNLTSDQHRILTKLIFDVQSDWRAYGDLSPDDKDSLDALYTQFTKQYD